MGNNILETERLLLREFDSGDADFMFELLNTPNWIKYIGDRKVKTLDDARKYLESGALASYRKYGFGFWMVELKFVRVPIGTCGLVKREALDDVDIGFAFLPDFEGMGYGYESAMATLDYAKKELKLKRVVAITVKFNEASIGLLNKIGLKYEKMIRLRNDAEDLMLFSINLEEEKQVFRK